MAAESCREARKAAESRREPTRWRHVVAARLPKPECPQARMLITAIHARMGELTVFDKLSGVALVDAVAASCLSCDACHIGAKTDIDSGYHSNADNPGPRSGVGGSS